METNPFRPSQKESYEQQLDLSAPTPKGLEETDDLVDVGLTSTLPTGAEQEQQPKFLETSASSLLTAGGALGPKVSGGTMGSSGTAATQGGAAGQTASSSSPGLFSRLCGWFSVEYYQPYFDVSSATVLDRIKHALMPHKSDLFASTSESPPDLWGAVWISLTLIFLIGATSNLNAFLAHSSSKEPWERDFRILSFASTMVFIYTFAVPLVMWGASLYVGVDPRPSLVRMIAIYGYAMVLFVPVSLLCVIPSAAFQWIIVLLAGGCSGVVLIRNLYTAFGTSYSALSQTDTEAQGSLTGDAASASRTKTSFLLISGAAVLHGVFSLMLKLFFFQGADLAATISDKDTDKGGKGGSA
jgi:hypothetical protein